MQSSFLSSGKDNLARIIFLEDLPCIWRELLGASCVHALAKIGSTPEEYCHTPTFPAYNTFPLRGDKNTKTTESIVIAANGRKSSCFPLCA